MLMDSYLKIYVMLLCVLRWCLNLVQTQHPIHRAGPTAVSLPLPPPHYTAGGKA